MIRINFLSSFKDYASAQGVAGVQLFDEDERKQVLIDIAKRIVILAIGPLGLYVYEIQTIPVLEDTKKQNAAKVEDLKKFIDSKQGLASEITKYDEQKIRFEAQMDFITKIQSDKLNEYKLFRILKDSTPATVWINNLSLNENVLQISGESVDPADIAKFTEKLSNSDFILNLIPLSQSTKGNYLESGVDTTVFQIKANLKAGATK